MTFLKEKETVSIVTNFLVIFFQKHIYTQENKTELITTASSDTSADKTNICNIHRVTNIITGYF